MYKVGDHKYVVKGPSIVAVEITGIKKDSNGKRVYIVKQICHDIDNDAVDENMLFDTTKKAAEKSLSLMGL